VILNDPAELSARKLTLAQCDLASCCFFGLSGLKQRIPQLLRAPKALLTVGMMGAQFLVAAGCCTLSDDWWQQSQPSIRVGFDYWWLPVQVAISSTFIYSSRRGPNAALSVFDDREVATLAAIVLDAVQMWRSGAILSAERPFAAGDGRLIGCRLPITVFFHAHSPVDVGIRVPMPQRPALARIPQADAVTVDGISRLSCWRWRRTGVSFLSLLGCGWIWLVLHKRACVVGRLSDGERFMKLSEYGPRAITIENRHQNWVLGWC